eukprot:7173504-Prymnesium_polylepis.1
MFGIDGGFQLALADCVADVIERGAAAVPPPVVLYIRKLYAAQIDACRAAGGVKYGERFAECEFAKCFLEHIPSLADKSHMIVLE